MCIRAGHLAELNVQLGHLQAENNQLTNDVGWYEENYQEPWPEDEQQEDVVDSVDPAPDVRPPLDPSANAYEPAPAQAAAPQAFGQQETIMLEIAKALGKLGDKEPEKDASGSQIPVRKELDSIKVPP